MPLPTHPQQYCDPTSLVISAVSLKTIHMAIFAHTNEIFVYRTSEHAAEEQGGKVMMEIEHSAHEIKGEIMQRVAEKEKQRRLEECIIVGPKGDIGLGRFFGFGSRGGTLTITIDNEGDYLIERGGKEEGL